MRGGEGIAVLHIAGKNAGRSGYSDVLRSYLPMLLRSYLAVGKAKAMTELAAIYGETRKRRAFTLLYPLGDSWWNTESTSLGESDAFVESPKEDFALEITRTHGFRSSTSNYLSTRRTSRCSSEGSPEQQLPPYRSPRFVMGLVLDGPAPWLIFHHRLDHHITKHGKFISLEVPLTSSGWGRHEASSRRE